MNSNNKSNIKQANRKLSILLPIFTIVVVIAILILFYLISLSKSKVTIQEEIWPAASQVVKKSSYSPIITLYGKIESFQATRLESTIDADVEKVFVREGSNVKTEQLLIKLSDRDAKILEKQRQAEYDQIHAQLNELKIKNLSDKVALQQQEERVKLQKKEVVRLDILYKKQVSSESLLDQAKSLLNEQLLRYTQNKLEVENFSNVLKQKQAELLKAEANLEKAKLDIERTNIKAPYDGKVTTLNVAIGNRVQPGEILIELFPLLDIEVRAQIANKDLPIINKAIANNEKLYATAALDDINLEFELQRIAGSVESGQAGVDGIFILKTKNFFIAKNRIITLRLCLPPQKNLIAVPESAIFHGNTVYEIIDNRLHSRKVKIIGIWYNNENEALQLISAPTLSPGSLILTTHLLNARDGLQVNINKNPS